MPNSKRKNAAKAKILTNLQCNLPEQTRDSKRIPAGKNCIQNLAAERQTNNEIGNTRLDNTFQSLMM